MKDFHGFRKNKKQTLSGMQCGETIQPDRAEEVYMISPQAPYHAFKVQSI